MSFDADDEITQDFLVEAGEILEKLGEQLVELERRPADKDLLNAVFRGFHTIKGGASFINLTALVEVCHVAEDVFNLLRTGQRQVDAHLMDVILRVLDSLNLMFDSVRAAKEPAHAEPELIAQLKALQSGQPIHSPVPPPAAPVAPPVAVAPPPPPPPAAVAAPAAAAKKGPSDISDDEFAKLLDAIDSNASAPAAEVMPAEPATVGGGDDITDGEFEALLDQLHGKGHHAGVPGSPAASAAVPTPIAASAPPPPPSASSGNDDEISEAEFDALLDQLHGKGRHSSAPEAPTANATPAPAVAAAVRAPAPAPAPTPPVPVKPVAAPAAVAAVETPKVPERATREVKAEETKSEDSKKAPEAETTVRVDTKRLDDIMNMVGELVLVRNRLVTLGTALNNEEMSHAVSNLDLVTADLQAAVMKTRMQPIKKVFGRFPRVVRDLARSLKKEVTLELVGEETDLDKNLVEALADPLVHLVRNAVDHGIETPEVRERAGKPRTGLVVLAAAQEGDHILLTITDDGAGMDADFLRRKAVEKGIMDEESAARLDTKDCYNLIFAPGFSTKSEITDVSGRGVGMDVVKTRIVQLNGTVDVDSTKGVGSRIAIKVPLTLAIMPTLMVALGRQIFALPLVNVVEIFSLDLTRTNMVDGQLVIMLRDKPLPLYFLKDWLVRNGAGQERPKKGHVVIVAVGSQRVGFVVEFLIGQEEVVIKPLGVMLQGTRGMAGATITGDGRIALILDVPGLIKGYAGRR